LDVWLVLIEFPFGLRDECREIGNVLHLPFLDEVFRKSGHLLPAYGRFERLRGIQIGRTKVLSVLAVHDDAEQVEPDDTRAFLRDGLEHLVAVTELLDCLVDVADDRVDEHIVNECDRADDLT
jgi:hypothetical protein